MSFEEIKQFPLELQIKILVEHMDMQTLKNLCMTDSYFRDICSNELIWQPIFQKLAKESNVNLVKTVMENEGTSLERAKLLWILSHPQKIVGIKITKQSETEFPGAVHNENPDTQDEFYTGEEFLITYSTSNSNEAMRCMIRDYNARVEPIYTKLNNLMKDVIDEFYTENNPSLLGYVNAINNIVTGKRNLTLDILTNQYSPFDSSNINMYPTSLTLFNFGKTDQITIVSIHGGAYTFAVTGSLQDLDTQKNLKTVLEYYKIKFTKTVSNYTKPTGTAGMTGEEYVKWRFYKIAQRSLDDIKDSNYLVLEAILRPCSIYSSLVPKNVSIPPQVRYTKAVSRLKAPTNMKLPPAPHRLSDLKAFPPPEDWIRRLER